MLQYMQSQPAKHICSHPLDFDDYEAVIRLGYVASQERFGLAIRAVNKTRRFWPGEIQLIVAIDDRTRLLWLEESPHCIFRTPDELQVVLDNHRESGSLLVPDQSGSAGDATLHALASGAPLDALNLHVRHPGTRKAKPRYGDGFLAVGRTPNRRDWTPAAKRVG